MTFVDPGNGEHVKSAVHGALFTLASMCAIYNGCAWLTRREGHLAANSAIYAAIAAYETFQVLHHVEQSR